MANDRKRKIIKGLPGFILGLSTGIVGIVVLAFGYALYQMHVAAQVAERVADTATAGLLGLLALLLL